MTNFFTVTLVADSIEQLHTNMRDMLPAGGVLSPIDTMPLQELLLKVDERCTAEGYEMEVWKMGERPEPELAPAEKKKAEARAKLRGDLIDSLAEATHATNAVKEDLAEAKPAEDEGTTITKPKKGTAKAKTNGKESNEALKARIILRLQELYSEGRKADVNKLLAAHGNGLKTFSAIPADQFGPIAEAVEAL